MSFLNLEELIRKDLEIKNQIRGLRIEYIRRIGRMKLMDKGLLKDYSSKLSKLLTDLETEVSKGVRIHNKIDDILDQLETRLEDELPE